MHKKRFFILFLLAFIFLNYRLSTIDYRLANAEVKIVAIVNNEIITQKDLDDFVNFTAMQYSKEYSGRELEEKMAALKPELLDKLIEDSLILQEAKKNNIAIDETRVREKIEAIKRDYNGDVNFQAALKKQGLVQADVERRLRNQMLTLSIIQEKVRKKIIVRPDEVTEFYNHNSEKFISPEEREVLVVTLENRDLANSFSYHFRAGQKIEDLATRYPFTVNKLTAVKGENLRKEVDEAVFKMGLSEVSSPVKIDEKYYVFKLENIIPPAKRTLAEAQEEINNYLFDTKMQAAFDKWMKEIKEGSYIKITEE